MLCWCGFATTDVVEFDIVDPHFLRVAQLHFSEMDGIYFRKPRCRRRVGGARVLSVAVARDAAAVRRYAKFFDWVVGRRVDEVEQALRLVAKELEVVGVQQSHLAF